MAQYTNLLAGDPASWFHQRSFANPRYSFDTAAGSYIMICFFASAATEHAQAALKAAHARPDLFSDDKVSFFGVSVDPEDESEQRVKDQYPGFRYFWDFDHKISRLYGMCPVEPGQEDVRMLCRWVVLDPTLRVMKVTPFRTDGFEIAEVIGFIEGLAPVDRFAGTVLQAPIIVLPNVFEPEFCEKLIAERIKAKVTTIEGSHASLASHADEVAAVIEAAAGAK